MSIENIVKTVRAASSVPTRRLQLGTYAADGKFTAVMNLGTVTGTCRTAAEVVAALAAQPPTSKDGRVKVSLPGTAVAGPSGKAGDEVILTPHPVAVRAAAEGFGVDVPEGFADVAHVNRIGTNGAAAGTNGAAAGTNGTH